MSNTHQQVPLTVEDVQLIHALVDAIEDAKIRDHVNTTVTLTASVDALEKLIREPLKLLRLAAQTLDTVEFMGLDE